MGRKLKRTICIVAEGEADKAFVEHCKSIFSAGRARNAPKITVKSAGGKGPDNVIGDALGTLASSGCDVVVAFLDTDIPWPKTKVRAAESKKILLIGNTPCLEGTLVDVLKMLPPTPATNHSLKSVIHPKLSGNPTRKESYADTFTKKILESAIGRVEAISELVAVLRSE